MGIYTPFCPQRTIIQDLLLTSNSTIQQTQPHSSKPPPPQPIMYNSPNERGLRRDNNSSINPNLPATQMPPTYGQSAASGPAPTTAGHHKHDFLNKIDPAVDSTRDNQPLPPPPSQHNNNIPSGTYGPHKSRLANALDPRVDSDMDSSRNQHFSGGPAGAPPTMHGATGPGPLSSHPNNIPEGTYGPHSSRMANTLDPRVDSDMERQRSMPAKHGYGAVGNPIPEGSYGPHGTRAGNMMDPRVDSDRDGGRHRGMGGVGNSHLPGPAPNTAGPHKSDLLNKLDPRVDSKGGMTYQETERRGL
ncbi:uncharacterized protein PODANS_5_820 [Podospora anserina S mat+]|uniref:Podospora anserina S mat+ genomic DNA chromosome 5, supercontig 1 n=1 Tax=Podospora anserina (strain S / ATCC MYA-4624 / DSM 980 / FGSC 10383) TaxID=515849 RepID=B2AF17_PODAN|nr:uncharacterized protein PODANS_5_820 [Podospora anserina S mat+]CAP62034.1 unnamed protein product [Podospora anserina S mat+]CDP29110.1 Putative protein of unknown function [Podospora anserina S mat+]